MMIEQVDRLRTLSTLSGGFPIIEYSEEVGEYLVGWSGAVTSYEVAMLIAGSALGIFPTSAMKEAATKAHNKLATCSLTYIDPEISNATSASPRLRDAFNMVFRVITVSNPNVYEFFSSNAREILRRLEVPNECLTFYPT